VPDCIFCAIVSGDAPSEIVDADERTLSFMDINPATPGHALVIPKQHAENIHDIDPDDLAAVTLAAQRLADRMRTTLEPAGINLIQANGRAAFQTVFHFHVHVIPRYAGDAIKMPWIPTPGDTGRIAELAERLRETIVEAVVSPRPDGERRSRAARSDGPWEA
jgi:histidine triad (HIT) family protein